MLRKRRLVQILLPEHDIVVYRVEDITVDTHTRFYLSVEYCMQNKIQYEYS